ncbi:DUF739 domain-containing protein [bacterium]|nr:DUF739 domain-containing protein [bacterium]
MIRTDKLLGIMAERKVTQKDMAKKLNIAPKTFYAKMKKGVFGSDEIEIMVDELSIDEPWNIFFAKKVTY